MTKVRQISISEQLDNELQKYLGRTAFVNVNELTEYILQDFLDKKDSKELGGSGAEENDQIKKRLESLGYL